MFKRCIMAIFIMVLCISMDAGAQVMKPASNVHPRVLLTQEHKATINANIDRYSADLKSVRTYATYTLPEQDGVLDFLTSMQLECRAFMYQMGELSEEAAKETIAHTIKYLKNPQTDETYSVSIYKDFGQYGIQTGALVYDWMYEAMTESQRTELAAEIRELMYSDAQPCTPVNVDQWNDIAGYSVGLPLVYNSMAAIALYDVYPDIYNAIMPKIQGTMADAVKRFGENGALSDGSIAYIREHYTYYVATMFNRLGFDISTLYGDQTPIGYKLMYSRLPWGGLIRQGDDFAQANYQFGSYVRGAETSALGLLATLYNNQYFAFQYNGNNNTTGLEKLLYFVNDLTPKMPDDLPLAYYVDEPRSEILARTSWQYGENSPAVVAYMNMNNRRSCDHDHANAGNFQIYYKGALTAPRGKYAGTGWGKGHWLNYYSRSIASNCMLIYDENENYVFPNQTPSNDGGQQMASRNGAYVVSSVDDFFAEENHKVITESHFIGPEEKTPAFSYIKGDLTNAYSDKVESYKRSMIFMDLFDEDIPAAMIVYDKVKSSNANFKKTWVLNSFTEPQVNNAQGVYPVTSFTTSEEGSKGKLENTTLLPASPTITTVGGNGHDYEVNGTQYEADDTTDVLYDNGWRTEISPSAANTDDTFLNVMFVADIGQTKKPDISYIDGVLFHGVSVQDRAVYFSRSADVSTTFSIDVPSSDAGETRVLVTDLAAGYWTVRSDVKTTFCVYVDEDSNSLTFNGAGGKYNFFPNEGSSATPMTFEDASKEAIGDFAVRLDGEYIYLPAETMDINGIPYVSACDIFPELGFTASVNNGSVTVSKGDKTVVFDGVDLNNYVFNGIKFSLNNSIIEENGKLYVPLTELEMLLSGYVKYDLLSAVADITTAAVETEFINEYAMMNYTNEMPLNLKFYADNPLVDITIDDKITNCVLELSGHIIETQADISQLAAGLHTISIKCGNSKAEKEFYVVNSCDAQKLAGQNFNGESIGSFSVVVNNGTKGYITNTSNNTAAYGITINKNINNSSNFLNFSGFKSTYGNNKIEFDAFISAEGGKLSLELRDYFGSVPKGGATLDICRSDGFMCDGKTAYPIGEWFKVCIDIDTANALASFYLNDTFLFRKQFICDGLSAIRLVCDTGENNTSFNFDNIALIYTKYNLMDLGLKTQASVSGNTMSVEIDGTNSSTGRMKLVRVIKHDDTIYDLKSEIVELDWQRKATAQFTLPDDYKTEDYVYELYSVHLDDAFDIFKFFYEIK